MVVCERRGIASVVVGLVVALAFLVPGRAAAQWTSVAPGIEYAEFTEPGPNRVFVTRMARAEETAIVDTMIGQGRLLGGRETVSGMVRRYDDTIGFWGREWGQRYDVVAAINGSFFNLDTAAFDGLVIGGSYASRFGNMGGGSGFVWTLNRDAFLGGCVHHPPDRQFVTFADGTTTLELNGINTSRGGDALVLYTLHDGARTPTDGSGIEVDVALEQPLLIHPRPSTVSGTAVAVRDGAGATEVFFDHVILSAAGSAAATVRGNVAVGDTIGISQELANYARDCSTRRGDDWTNAYASVAGWPPVLEDGTVVASGDAAVHPRTAIALNDSHVFFVVVDGRSGVSVGMTLDALGSFCRDRLGATWATNQDGGGSSTLWVNGEIKNSPSDGSERAVANGAMMVHLLPAERSSALGVDDTVETTSSATLRLGPGDNYPEHDTVGAGAAGRVLPHPANGLLARGAHWWLCELGGTSGWADETALRRTGTSADADADAGDAGGADADADAPVTPDSVDVPRDADGGRPDVLLPPGDDGGGCGCRTADARGAGPFAVLVFAVVLVRLRRRRPDR